jgi:hypothetical protein
MSNKLPSNPWLPLSTALFRRFVFSPSAGFAFCDTQGLFLRKHPMQPRARFE